MSNEKRLEPSLNADQRAELEKRGPANVRMKLQYAGPGRGAAVDGFETGTLLRGLIEDWLAEKDALEATERSSTLLWAKIAGWAAIISVIATVLLGIATIGVTVWLALKSSTGS